MRTLLIPSFIALTSIFVVGTVQADQNQGPFVAAVVSGGANSADFGADKRSLRRDSGPAGNYAGVAGSIALSFDAGNKQVSAVQFLISADTDLSKADISGCADALPDTHVGGCKIKGENILFYAFSPVNAALPSGVLGTISLGSVGVAGQVKVSEPVMADVNGVEMTLD